MFTGEFNHTIDAKGRVIVPNKFRNLLGEDFVVTKNLDGCLAIYDKNSWDELEKKLNVLPLTDNRARMIKRFILGGSEVLVADKQGRILIPIALRKYAQLNEDIVFLGVGDHIEIWDKKTFDETNDFTDFETISKNLEGLGI